MIRLISTTILNAVKWLASVIKALIQGRPVRIDSFSAATIEKDDYELVGRILTKPEIWVNGDSIIEYEKAFADYIGVERAFSFLGGRVALSAILEAIGIGYDDEVIVPAYTCVVVPNAIRYSGAKPVFSDIEMDTMGLDVKKLEKAITKNTKAILLHHLFGLVCRDYEQILQLAKERGIFVIEDCAHALGAVWKGTKVGCYGDAAFFSTEQSKVISTRMGGIALSKHDHISKRLQEIQATSPFPCRETIFLMLKDILWSYRKFRSKNSWWICPWIKEYSKKYSVISTTEQELRGKKPEHYFRRLPNALAVVGLNQLEKLDILNEKRREAAGKWDIWAKKSGYKTFMILPQSVPVYLRYPILVDAEKKKDNSWAKKLGIELGVWFISMEHPRKVECNYENASKAIERCVNLPVLNRRGNNI